MHPCSWKISILKKESGKNFVHFDRKNILEDKIMQLPQILFCPSAPQSHTGETPPRFALRGEQGFSGYQFLFSFYSILGQRSVILDRKLCQAPRGWTAQKWWGQPTHSHPVEMRSHPQNLSLVRWAHYLESNINDNDIERWAADFKITVWPSEALPSSSSVRGFTFFLIEGLRGIFNSSFRTVCVLFHSILYSHSLIMSYSF